MKRRGHADPVTPELRAYVFAREGGCLVAQLADHGEIRLSVGCRDRFGTPVDGRVVSLRGADRILTVAHIRDRAGGRTGKRPPSTRQRTAAVCAGHALPPDNIVDRVDVREAVDRYLEDLEGPEIDSSRPWELIRRVRATRVDSQTSE